MKPTPLRGRPVRDPYLVPRPAVVSFSGGRTSGFMLKRIVDASLPGDVAAVFANTGMEHPATRDAAADPMFASHRAPKARPGAAVVLPEASTPRRERRPEVGRSRGGARVRRAGRGPLARAYP